MKGTALHPLIGAYIRVGRSSKAGPIYRVKKLNTDTRAFTTENLANGLVSAIGVKELEKGMEEGIVHLMGKARRDS